MKKLIKLLGIIAIVAIIGFSFSTCNDDDENGGTVTFSFAEFGTGVFTVVVDGAKWNETNTTISGLNMLVSASGMLTANRVSDGYEFKTARLEDVFVIDNRTSNVLTLMISPVLFNVRGTLIMPNPNEKIENVGEHLTNGGYSSTYKVNSVKSSITF